MTTLIELRDLLTEAVEAEATDKVLIRQLSALGNQQSQIIVALIRAKGGFIEGEIWDEVHAVGGFMPYSKEAHGNGIIIRESQKELTDGKETKTDSA